MFIKSIKIRKPKALGIAMIAMVICIAALLVVFACRVSKQEIYDLGSETKRQAFLKEMGWEVSDEYDECRAVTIPEEWNEVYTNYNKLQKEQGFDLTAYKGKDIEVYTYKIKNYPQHEGEEGIICNLMVFDGKLIGGDVCSTAIDGFMQGIKK